MEPKPLIEQIKDLQQSVNASNEALAILSSKLDKVLKQDSQKQNTVVGKTLDIFIKQSLKFWRWFGTKSEFLKQKIITLILGVLYVLFSIIAMCFTKVATGYFSGFSYIEALSLIFGIIIIIRCFRTKQEIPDVILKRLCITKFEQNCYGLYFSNNKRKVLPRLYFWLSLIGSSLNFIYVLMTHGDLFVLSAIFEALTFASVFAFYFSTIALFAQYSFVLYKGKNDEGKPIVLVHDPVIKHVVTLEEHKKMNPYLYM